MEKIMDSGRLNRSWRVQFALPFVASALFAAPAAQAQVGTVVSFQKVSDIEGDFLGTLSNGDGFGRSIAEIGDLNGDGVSEIAVGALGDSDAGWRRGAVWILFPNSFGMITSEVKINDVNGGFGGVLNDGDLFGRSVAGIGDIDFDGVPDLAVGAPHDGASSGVERGAVWVLRMNSNGTVKNQTKISQTTGGFSTVPNGPIDGRDQFGHSLTSLGDLNGDGVPDLAVGARGDDDGGPLGSGYNLGAVWVLYLNSNGSVSSQAKISSFYGGFTGAEEFQNRQVGVGADSLTNLGDLDGDGRMELGVGAVGDREAPSLIWTLSLNSDGSVYRQQAFGANLAGFNETFEITDAFGFSLANIGDLDRDGVNDLAIGAPGDDDNGRDKGAVWIAFMNADGTVHGHQKISEWAGNFAGGLDLIDRFGTALACVGDINGDGAKDLASGAHLDDDGGDRRGAAYLMNLRRENVEPSFVPSDWCGQTVTATVGETISLSVRVTDADAGDVVTLDTFDMPTGSFAMPNERMVGNPTELTFDWTPLAGDEGMHTVRFQASDAMGAMVECTTSLEILAIVDDPQGTCEEGQPYHRRQPGSLLLFPEYDNREGSVTFLTVTNTNCDALNGSVQIEYRYIRERTCIKEDRSATLTPCDTLTLLTSSQGLQNGRGYAYVYAKNLQGTSANPGGEPISWNYLIGQELVIDGYTQHAYSMNAVSFEAFLADGDSTEFDNDGIRDLDGAEYGQAPDKLLIPRFIAQFDFEGLPEGGPNGDLGPLIPLAPHQSQLILIALSGGRGFTASELFPFLGTSADFLIYNDNEEAFSAEYSFSCWAKPRLLEISNAFSQSFLFGTNQDPSEVNTSGHAFGFPETGWFWIDGGVANSVADSILDPALYAVLVENSAFASPDGSADLPFEYCSQINGDLLPTSILGDAPTQVGDNQ